MAEPSDESRNEESKNDPFSPPAVPCEVQCIHCGETYDSWQIVWRETPDEGALRGTWCCPTNGCDGVGFGFDIFPTDPTWADENGDQFIVHFDDDDGEAEDEEEEDEDTLAPSNVDEFDADAFWIDFELLRPRALGNTPQPPFDSSPPSKLFESLDTDGSDDDIPF